MSTKANHDHDISPSGVIMLERKNSEVKSEEVSSEGVASAQRSRVNSGTEGIDSLVPNSRSSSQHRVRKSLSEEESYESMRVIDLEFQPPAEGTPAAIALAGN